MGTVSGRLKTTLLNVKSLFIKFLARRKSDKNDRTGRTAPLTEAACCVAGEGLSRKAAAC